MRLMSKAQLRRRKIGIACEDRQQVHWDDSIVSVSKKIKERLDFASGEYLEKFIIKFQYQNTRA